MCTNKAAASLQQCHRNYQKLLTQLHHYHFSADFFFFFLFPTTLSSQFKRFLENMRNQDSFSRVSVTCFPGAPHSNSSTSLQTGGSAFGGSKDGMHQRSFSVSSADQWNEAINTSTSSGARKKNLPHPLRPHRCAEKFPPHHHPRKKSYM